MADHRIKELPELTGETFYHDKNSIYLRVTYLPDNEGYRITMFNELTISEDDENQEDKVKLFILARGLAEIALQEPNMAFEYGYDSQATDAIDLNDDLSDDEKTLLKHPVGTA